MGVMAEKGRAEQEPLEQVTLVYRTIGGAHSFSALEVPGLVVLDHDLRRAFDCAVKGVGELVSMLCEERVQYDVDMTFETFTAKIAKQNGTVNRDSVVTIPSKVHRAEAFA